MNKEFLEKAKGCKTPEEVRALAEQSNVELSEDELMEVVGGSHVDNFPMREVFTPKGKRYSASQREL